MRPQHLLALAMLPLLLSCGNDSNTTAPTTPTAASTPTTPTAPTAPGTNHAPTISLQSVSPQIALVGGSNVGFSVTASDPDGDPLSFAWDFGDGTTITGTGGGVSHVFDSEGTFRVFITVTDGRGGSDTVEAGVTARKLTGTWRMDDARHSQLTARLTQGNGHAVSGSVNGTYSGELNGSAGDGTVTLRFTSGSRYCVESGSYSGSVDAGINTIDFAGPGCNGFSLHRQ